MNKAQKKLLNEQAEYIIKRVYAYPQAAPLNKEDCLSFVFNEMLKRITTFDLERGNIKSFIYINVRNLVYSYWKRNVYNQPGSHCKAIWNELEPIEDGSFIEDVEPTHWEKRRDVAIAHCINELGCDDRNIVLLYYYDNLVEVKIARMLGITHQAVSYRLHRALNKLKPKIESRLRELDSIRSEL